MGTYVFTCLGCSNFWLQKVKAAFGEPIFFITLVYWAIAKVETLGAAAPSSVTDLV